MYCTVLRSMRRVVISPLRRDRLHKACIIATAATSYNLYLIYICVYYDNIHTFIIII